MSKLSFGNKVVNYPLDTILKEVRNINPNFLRDIRSGHDEINVTCPFHKNGQENKPSCFVHNNSNDENYGIYHCFTCGSSGTFQELISHCLNLSEADTIEWLIENFCDYFIERSSFLPPIELNNNINKKIDESILDKYKYIHPYVLSRGISVDVIKKFSIGWDKEDNTITFPCWDIHGNLVGIFKRYIEKKRFYIPPDIEKPIYLLNFLIRENIDIAYVVESTFNALSLWTWGYPAICLFGTGSRDQYDILKKSGIRNYILCFDGDEAGQKGRDRFIKNMNSNCFIEYKILPEGRDVNNLTKEQFDNLISIFV